MKMKSKLKPERNDLHKANEDEIKEEIIAKRTSYGQWRKLGDDLIFRNLNFNFFTLV